MNKIASTVIIRGAASALIAFALTVFCVTGVFAKNNCESNAVTINPALAVNSGIGGTGTPVAAAGIGGTGLYDGGMGGTGNLESGIGGTGAIADKGGIGGTGIVGVITGFASICVNGVEVHYDEATPILVDGRMSTVRELAVGQLVAARAVGAGYELTASNIAVIHAAVGPVSGMDMEAGVMRVLGQTVHIGALEGDSRITALQTGDWVRISGHRLANGDIAASRIEATAPLVQAHITGYVEQTGEQSIVVSGTPVRFDAQMVSEGVTQGTEVQVSGYWDGAYLQAQQVVVEPLRQSLGNVEHVVIEGYIHNRDNREMNLSNRFVVLDTGANAAGAAMDDFRVDQRVLISGRVGVDQRITPERIETAGTAAVPVFERAILDGGVRMEKEVAPGSDDKPPVDQDDSLNHQPSSSDRDENKVDHIDPITQSDTESVLTTDLDLVREIGEHRDFQREVETPDPVRDVIDFRDHVRDIDALDHIRDMRDFSGHQDRLFIDR